MTHLPPSLSPLSPDALPLHGGDIWTAARQMSTDSDTLHDFSTNTFLHMAPRTTELVESALLTHAQGKKFLHYPDPHMQDLRQALARYESLDPANILPGSGASELIWAVLTALRPRKALFIGPLFTQYARACDALSIPWEVITPPLSSPHTQNFGFSGAFAPDADTLTAIAESRHRGVDLVIACSPNNPGTAILHDPSPLLSAVGSRSLILDVSYKDFLTSPATLSSHHWHNLQSLSRARVITLGSLTKFFCCPGIRLGWVAADDALISRIEQCRPAWTMPALAQEVGSLLLAHAPEYRAALPLLQHDVDALVDTLRISPLFHHIAPGVSFAIAQLAPQNSATALRQHLLHHHILIRVCDNIPGMPPNFVRIQAQPGERECEGRRKIGGALPCQPGAGLQTSPQGE